MSFMSKLIATAVVATLSFASSGFAQSFNRADGTGNELPAYYDNAGGLHAGVAPSPHNKIVVNRRLFATTR
jgi:hypothetical protein